MYTSSETGNDTVFSAVERVFLEFSISLAVLFKKQPDVIINFSDDPLNDVERVYNRDCVGKILIHVRNILVVHVGNEIFYSSSLFHWKGGKVGFCDIRTSTAEQINWIALLLHSSPKTIQKYISISEEQIPETMEIARERQHQLAVKQKEQEIEEARKMVLAGYPIPKYIKLFVKRDILAA